MLVLASATEIGEWLASQGPASERRLVHLNECGGFRPSGLIAMAEHVVRHAH